MQTARSTSPVSAQHSANGSFQTQQQQDQQKQQLLHEQQSASRRLLARFTSSFAAKPRSIGEFTISLDDALRQYSNGDVVKGHVKLQVLRPVKITHLVISLAGIVQVHKNPRTGNESEKSVAASLVGSGKSSTGGAGRYHGNGIATLFDDEIVLCGDGRLGDRTYQFNFELQFPDKELPSSIDFERGTITYVITATLTRPTTISPTSTTEKLVRFVERIDIARLYPPKSRTIILDPISKRSRAKSQAIKRIDANDRRNSSRSTLNGTAAARQSSSSQDGDRPLSPVPSEVSEDSRASSIAVASPNGSVTASPAASLVGRASHSRTGNGYKTISTTVQPRAGGCLRGDQMLVDIKVNHTKYMKSMNGIIVTLYRTARVDTQPALPIGVIDGSKKEEYFSRSFTGLGGLSLSGAGSSHIFRKDLAQVVMPLVVNPSTLGAEVVAKLRVPEEAFPTISGVPGAMLSFRYYLEVVVDIQGRLAGPEKAMNSLGELTSTTMTPESYEIDHSATTATGQSILNTTYVRRDKGVVSAAFEIVVGTLDSERRKGKQKAEVGPEGSPAQLAVPSHPPAFESILGVRSSPYLDRSPSINSAVPATPDIEAWPDTNDEYYHDYGYASPSYVPPPQMPDEAQMTEKERVRLAETRLLPSAPPGLDDDDQDAITPTAPHIDEHGMPLAEESPAPRDEYATHVNGDARPQSDPATPTQHADATASAAIVATVMLPADDKQELERARLHALASEPPEGAAGSASVLHPMVHTVPEHTITHAHDSHAEAAESADLPRYER